MGFLSPRAANRHGRNVCTPATLSQRSHAHPAATCRYLQPQSQGSEVVRERGHLCRYYDGTLIYSANRLSTIRQILRIFEHGSLSLFCGASRQDLRPEETEVFMPAATSVATCLLLNRRFSAVRRHRSPRSAATRLCL